MERVSLQKLKMEDPWAYKDYPGDGIYLVEDVSGEFYISTVTDDMCQCHFIGRSLAEGLEVDSGAKEMIPEFTPDVKLPGDSAMDIFIEGQKSIMDYTLKLTNKG